MRKDEIRNGLAIGDAIGSLLQKQQPDVCEVCGAKLTDEEVEVLGTMCLDCAQGDDSEWRHPDEFDRAGKSPYEL